MTLQEQLERANADWIKASDDWDKASAARKQAAADWYKASEEIARIQALINQGEQA